MGPHVMGVGDHLHQKVLLLQILHHSLSCLITVHAEIFSGNVYGGVVIHDADLFQVMALSHLKVVGIMGRCDLHTASPELLVHVFIGHHRDLPVR